MRRQRLGHARLYLPSRRAEGEYAIYIGRVSTPAAVVGLLVDHEVVPHRRSSNPVALRIAASVPGGTESESLPATVTVRRPSVLRHISCEP